MVVKKLAAALTGVVLSAAAWAQVAPIPGAALQNAPAASPASAAQVAAQSAQPSGQPAAQAAYPPGTYPGYSAPAPVANPALAGAYAGPAPAPAAAAAVSAPVAPAPQQPPSALPPLPSDFELASQATLPMTPAQIVELRRMLDARQRAAAMPATPATAVTGTLSVSMSPGATPPVLRTAYGNTTSFTIVDATGAPWPVENFRIGNGVDFQVNRLDGPGGSVFTLDTMEPYSQTNLVLKLSGASTPIVLNVVAGQKSYDARAEIRVQGRGPNSVVTQAAPLVKGADTRLLSVLDGMAPAGGKALTVAGAANTSAWMMPNGRMVVRTPLVIVSPASIGGGTSFVSSADGTHVYEFMPSPNLLGMVDNQFVNVTIQGW